MVFKSNSAEGGSDGVTVTNANSSAGSSGSALVVSIAGSATLKYSTTSSMHGALSYSVIATSGSSDLAYFDFQGGNGTAGALRFYIMMSGRPGAAVRVVILAGTSASIGLNINASARFSVVDNTGTGIMTATTTLISGVWYRVELAVTPLTTTTGTGSFAYYRGDSLTPVETIANFSASNFGTGTITYARYGKCSSGSAAVTLYYDDVAFSDASATFIGGFPLTATLPWARA